MAPYSSVPAWRIPVDEGAWWAPWSHKESDTTERLSTNSAVWSRQDLLLRIPGHFLIYQSMLPIATILNASFFPFFLPPSLPQIFEHLMSQVLGTHQ